MASEETLSAITEKASEIYRANQIKVKKEETKPIRFTAAITKAMEALGLGRDTSISDEEFRTICKRLGWRGGATTRARARKRKIQAMQPNLNFGQK